MSATKRSAMKRMPPEKKSYHNGFLHCLRAVGAGLVLLLGWSSPASAQQPDRIVVSGTVKSTEGAPLSGVLVTVQATDLRAVTGANGKYVLNNAPSDGVLNFALVG